MLIATDGACKRNGDPTCTSAGVAWIMHEEQFPPKTGSETMLFKAKFEKESTSQRGELNGIIECLEYAVANIHDNESLIIVTDSEYMFNTIEKDWVHKWARQGWMGSLGPVKNQDMWEHVIELLDNPMLVDNVYMQWTKGHLISYTPGNIKKAMQADATGLELYDRIMSVATRPADQGRIIRDFNRNRGDHGFPFVPDQDALEWAVANTVADCLASYIVKTFDDLLL